MNIFVTGASGYLGQEVVHGLVVSGHQVTGLVRGQSGATSMLNYTPSATALIGDLRRAERWPDVARRSDAIVHLAAQKQGNLHEQLAGTVATTDRLVRELGAAWTGRFVHASSFSVYDYRQLSPGDTLDETALVYDPVFAATPYSQTKILQERILVEYATASSARLAILRIAGIYGRGSAWNQGLAIRFSDSLGLMFAPRATMKLVYIDNVVSAIECALRSSAASSPPVNVIDDELPTFRSFSRRLRGAGCVVPRAIPVPFAALRLIESALSRLPGTDGPYPSRVELLSAAAIREGWLPLRYSNRLAKNTLGWNPAASLDKACAEARIAQSRGAGAT